MTRARVANYAGSAAFAAFSVAIACQTLALGDIASRWPLIVAAFLFAICLVDLVAVWRSDRSARPAQTSGENASASWKTLIMTLVFAGIALVFGLLAATGVLVAGHLFWIGRRSAWVSGLATLVVLGALFGFFEQLLGVTLYRGVFWE